MYFPLPSLIRWRPLLAVAAGTFAMVALGACVPRNQVVLATTPRPVPVAIAQMYAALPDEPFPIQAVDLSHLDPKYYRQVVPNTTGERPGTIVVDTAQRFLYLTLDGGQAIRYGVGIGRAGFAWAGKGYIAYKKVWPKWTPPAEMVARDPNAAPYVDGMAPGPDNPLGARALYIFQNGKDTLYRLHGSADPSSIGQAVSSGCVRLLQQDVIDLYSRVPDGTPVVVR